MLLRGPLIVAHEQVLIVALHPWYHPMPETAKTLSAAQPGPGQ
jgi:hypothetical protein